MRAGRIIATICAALAVTCLHAQYYDEGRDPFSTRWKQISGKNTRIVYPEQHEKSAERVAAVIDTMAPGLNYGFSMPPKRLPVVLHGANLQSNGVVSWAPKRSELVIAPPVNTFAVPWLKQLSIHEYRHVIQMSNLNRNTVKYISFLTGEQAVGAAGLLLPQWFLEGDATLAETLATEYGRGLQPEFTLEYRAYLDGADTDIFATDKWFCGSLKDYIPNHYYLGYQIAGMTYNKYGEGFWEKVTDYSTKYPFLIFPRAIAYKKYFGTTSKKMFQETFSELKSKWDSIPRQDDSATIIETPSTSYTLYSHPVFINDTMIAAVKNDLTRTSRIVAINSLTGEERVLTYTGNINSRPVYHNGELFWTEYRPSVFWEQKNSSVVRRMKINTLATGHEGIKTCRGLGSIYFITPYDNGFAAVEYGDSGEYSIKIFDGELNGRASIGIPDDTTIHGLAWDKPTNTLAAIALSEDGMFLARINADSESFTAITHPSHVTINNLSAGGGQLAYNSIISGRDETHIYDIASGNEYMATASTYGSVMPAFSPDGKTLVQATYRKNGYFVSTQVADTTQMARTGYAPLPANLFNMPLPEMAVTNVDTLKIYSGDSHKAYTSKRYRKAAHMFNFHSWAPLLFDPFGLSRDRDFDPEFGVTFISQNALSNTSAYAGYGRVDSENLFRGLLAFDMFAPRIEVGVEYGGGKRGAYIAHPAGFIEESKIPPYSDRDYFSLEVNVLLPINLSSGHMLRWLTPEVSLVHYNDLLYNYKKEAFDKGYQKVEATLAYTGQTRMAARDILPRWGYRVEGEMAFVPSRELFGTNYYLYGRAYTPGLAPHHSLQLRGAVQYLDSELYNFRNSLLLPKGCRHNFTSKHAWTTTADYRFPIAYPDNGIPGALYIKRIYANVFGGYSRFKRLRKNSHDKAYSYGMELVFNTNAFRMSNGNVDFRISGYNAKDLRGTSFGTSFGISIYM